MAEMYSGPPQGTAPTGAPQDGVSVLQNVARQIGQYAQAIVNAYPVPTTTISPRALGFALTTTATAILGTSSVRHGIVFANPGTASVYIFPTAIQTAPTTSVLGGALLVAAGGSASFPSSLYPNINCGWSAFASTGSNQAFTVIEFF